ncbi:MAG TPA: hypothetical protein VFN67_24995 [Polyangiales bacterium]|nr:hypothetical protein [Polyangiales bacterium]
MVDSLAVQRDALGTWPATVSDAYAQLQQLETELQAARQAGEPIQFRRKYRACLRLAARITRWLANRYAPEGDELPARDRVSGLLGRLSDRLALLTQLAAGVGVTLDVTEANTARTEAQSALDTGTAVQLRAAVRRYRNALDALQDQLPDPEA